MFTSASRTTRFACLSFAIVMAVAVNSAMLLTFDGVATDAIAAQCTRNANVAVLDPVIVVGHRT